jgi:hypothetical protein
MKKMNLMLVMAITATIITTTCNAQLFAGNSNANLEARAANKGLLKSDEETVEAKKISKANAKEIAKANKAAAKLTKANLRAAENFNKGFKDEQNATWFTEPEVITASFAKEDVKTTVVYDRKGNWLRTMKVYHEPQMSADIKRLIKKSYYSKCNITQVQEIKEGDITFYVVHLEDAKTFKLVAICNGEVNLYKEYNKQV